MKVAVYNIKGENTGRDIELPASVFGIEPNEHAVYLAIKQFNAAQRQGTHKAKEKSEVSGSTRKLKKQKGTGGARAGSIKNPLFMGGARVFGPRPRNYDIDVNKKVKKLARKSVLSEKFKKSQITVIEDFQLNAPRTKDFVNILNNLKIGDKKALLVTKDADNNIFLSARNLPNSHVVSVGSLNTYDILNSTALVLLEGSIEAITNTFE